MHIDRITEHTHAHEVTINTLGARVGTLEARLKPDYVLNSRSKVLHKIVLCDVQCSPMQWHSVCGWKFALSPHEVLSEPTTKHKRCAICFTDTGEALSDAESVA
eukprot:775598-Amphidinium_carterae.1